MDTHLETGVRALQGQEVPPASRFEVAILTRALLVACGFEDARYGYDRLGRLETVTAPWGAFRYEYACTNPAPICSSV